MNVKHRVLATLAAALAALGAPAAPAAEIVGVGNFSHIVGDLGRALGFYRDVIGLPVDTEPTEWSGNPVIMRLGATPGAESRIATLSIPGSALGVELIEYRDTDRHPQQVRFQDPGATVLQLRVRDLDTVLDRVRLSPGRIWTPSGEPVPLGEQRIIFVQDPDGFFVELIETPPGPGAPETGNVLGASFELIVYESDVNARFYRDGLGLDPVVGDGFDDTKLLTDTVNTLGAAFRRTALTLPGDVGMAFLEFRGITRAALTGRIQDPGTAILQLLTDDVPGMMQRLHEAGGHVVTTGGAPVDLGGGAEAVIVSDPNNLYIELLPPRE